jgi:hypothetical protein
VSIPCRPVVVAGLLVTAVACRATAPITALSPLAAPVRADVFHVASGVDSIQLSMRALLRNPFADTLTLETCGGAALHLEYADGERWRPVLQGVVMRPCGGYTEVRVAPGDSAIVANVIAGTRAERYLGLRWLAPLTARYRLTTRASRCLRRTRRDCWVTLASAPFDVRTAALRGDRP